MFDETNLREAHKIALSLFFIMIFMLVIYVALVEFSMSDSNLDPESAVNPLFRYIIKALAAVEVILIMIIKKPILSGKIKFPAPPSPEQPGIKKNSPEDKEREFITRLHVAHIIPYALCELIALHGLLLYIWEKDKTEFYAFLGVSLFLMLVHFPKYEDWKSRLEDYLSEH